MKKCAVVAFVVLLIAVALAPAAGAKAKTWKKVITCSGATESYTDQYDSKPFKLLGGRQKLVAIVVPDPELEENDMEDWWMGSWFVEQIGGWHSSFLTLDPDTTGTSGTGFFKLPKGRYFINPSTANCSWTVTLYEKR